MADNTITSSDQETRRLGKKFAQELYPGAVIALHGDLGSGKTTFTQGVAEGLGIKRQITSPTFLIQKSYQLPDGKIFYHLDFYRLQNEKEAENIGVQEILHPQENIIIIEWPEKISSLLPKQTVHIFFKFVDENRRKITFKQDE